VTRQRVEGASARLAHLALHGRRRAAFTELFRAAVATYRRFGELGLDQPDDIIGRALGRERRHQGVAPHRRQRPELSDKRLEFLCSS
jgi:hypothetical protein